MRRPRRLLDLFCCEGAATAGYLRGGWDEVYGVDMVARFRKRYPGTGFHAGDALLVLCTLLAGDKVEFVRRDGTSVWLGLEDFDAIHASPPCQGYTRGNAGKVTDWPKLIPGVRALLAATGLPYVIENVEDAGPAMVDPIGLCGCMFGMSVRDFTCSSPGEHEGVCDPEHGVIVHLQRLRLFESNVTLTAPRRCEGEGRARREHPSQPWVAGAYGGARRDKYEARFIRKGGYVPPDKALVKALLGIDHDVTWQGLYESIPPIYAEHIGRQLLAAIDPAADAAA